MIFFSQNPGARAPRVRVSAPPPKRTLILFTAVPSKTFPSCALRNMFSANGAFSFQPGATPQELMHLKSQAPEVRRNKARSAASAELRVCRPENQKPRGAAESIGSLEGNGVWLGEKRPEGDNGGTSRQRRSLQETEFQRQSRSQTESLGTR
jgi:hypothetical protein